MEGREYHRHLGIYGICIYNKKLLVIHKNRGPYTGRYDLPGGSIEPNENILNTVFREFIEETGVEVQITKNIGTKDFIVPWTRIGFDHTHCHHIAVFYEVKYISGDIGSSPNIDDSIGAEWIDIIKLSVDNSSPLVLEAKEWIETGIFNIKTIEWD